MTVKEMGPCAVDVGQRLDDGVWNGFKATIVLLAALTIVLDGMENQLMGLAVPSLMVEWNVPRGAFGQVFAIGFVALGIGSLALGWVNDRLGRRLALLSGVILFSLGTAAIGQAQDMTQLILIRSIACLGLGGVPAVAVGIVAELAPSRHRVVAVTASIVCFSVGGILGGLLAAAVLPTFGWRALFVGAGLGSLLVGMALIPVIPESPRFLAGRPNSAEALWRLMRRLGHEELQGTRFTRAADDTVNSASLLSLLAPGLRRDTLGLWLAVGLGLLCVYLMYSWTPTLLFSAGFSTAQASLGLTVFNVGGLVGSVIGAMLISRWGSRSVMLGMAVLGIASALCLALTPLEPGAGFAVLLVQLVGAGLVISALQSATYALAAHMYPTDLRGRGLGAMSAVGRIGAIVSSMGAIFLAGGSFTFFGVIASALALNFIGLAVVRNHIPPTADAQPRRLGVVNDAT